MDRSMEVWWAEIQMWRLGESKRGGQVGRCEGWVNLNVEVRWADVRLVEPKRAGQVGRCESWVNLNMVRWEDVEAG